MALVAAPTTPARKRKAGAVRPHPQRPCIAASCLGAAGVDLIKKAKKSVGRGGLTCNAADLEGATHLVVADVCARSNKVVAALAHAAERDVAIVTLRWVEDSILLGQWVVEPSKLGAYRPKNVPLAGLTGLTAGAEAQSPGKRARKSAPPRPGIFTGLAIKVVDPAGAACGSVDPFVASVIAAQGGKVWEGGDGSAANPPVPLTEQQVKESVFQGALQCFAVDEAAPKEAAAPARPEDEVVAFGKKLPNRSSRDQPPPVPTLRADPAAATAPVGADPPPTYPSTYPSQQTEYSTDLVKRKEPPLPYLALVPVAEGAKTVPARIVLDKDVLTVGRMSKKSSVDIQLDSETVRRNISRKHASLRRTLAEDGLSYQVTIVDEGSTNGYFVNNIKRAKATLTDGDVVVFGGGGDLENGWRVNDIDSDCVYQFHSG
eukprot:TRINITY_DN11274_c0_g1_i1.p1 TRINITY_DN11274_c0_g1~~TRINITY_DN11274_c0_g1_i1.p1  ORF type:complete len:431 (+),score=139.17 TRINITY_DN11274_c0_g1_i1:51-1343(+)